MAIYEYRCIKKTCEKVFEKWGKKFDESTDDEVCPSCNSKAKRIYSSGQLIIL